MALQQTKKIEKRITKETITKQKLARKLNTSVSKINEYILGDEIPPQNIKIITKSDGYVELHWSKEVKVAKYEGVWFNELKNGDKTYYITYKDSKNIKHTLKIGRQSDGITESYCANKRFEVLEKIKQGETPTKIKNKRVINLIKTFDMIAFEYFEYKSLELSAKNIKDSIAFYNKHIKPFIGNQDIEKISSDDINEIIFSKKEELAPKTLKSIIEKISSIYKFAIKKSIFKGLNPTLNTVKVNFDNQRTRFLSKSEIEILIKEVKDNDLLYLYVMLSLSTGGRVATICNIKIKDIHLEMNFIDLRDLKNQNSYKGFIKNDKYFLEILKKHMKNKTSSQFLFGKDSLKENVSFIRKNLLPILNKLFNQHINENEIDLTTKKLAEIRKEKVVIHTLRHTFASQLVINGTPIYTVKELMNHKDIQQTMRYAKLAPDSGRNDIDNLF